MIKNNGYQCRYRRKYMNRKKYFRYGKLKKKSMQY